MAIEYETEFFTQGSIYDIRSKTTRRKVKSYFSIPDDGVNEHTGILLFIAGFGGNSNSNVYKKMRNIFADKYNLVTIQCDYFGWEFMQDSDKFETPKINREIIENIFNEKEINDLYIDNKLDFKKFLEMASKYNINLEVNAILEENAENFNDMGLMQAIDNITVVLNVMNILYDNGYVFNSKKVIVYGQSHGAYLSYLCNALAPTLFSLIIDNSAWIYPLYISNNNKRLLTSYIGNMKIIKQFNYLAKQIIDDNQIFDLKWLYSQFKNNCNIISYHGTNDNLISNFEKKIFCNSIAKCKYIEISEKDVDNVIFKSTNHSLDADFLKLFDYTMNNMNIQFKKCDTLDLINKVEYSTYKHKYIMDYSNIIPEIRIL